MNAEPEPEYLTAAQVAERIGVKVDSVYAYLSRGHMPEPDVVYLNRNLWLVATIDAWRAEYRKRRKGPRLPRRARRKSTTLRAPPRLAATAPLVPLDVDEQTARELAAELRGEGFYCTAGDVLELAAATRGLSREQEVVRRRIEARLRAGAQAD